MTAVFPVTDPGRPRTERAARPILAVLWWLVSVQRGRIAIGIAITGVWLGTQPLIPLFVGLAIDKGILAGSSHGLLVWSGALALVVALQAFGGIASYHFFIRSILDTEFRTSQVVAEKISQLGARLPGRVASGEVMSVGLVDAGNLGYCVGVLSHVGGSVVSFAVVVAILLVQSPLLGGIVLLAVPVMAAALWPLFTAIERRRDARRADIGVMNTLGTDTVTGLRVLRGIGGEAGFIRRYAEASQRVRRSGTGLARAEAVLAAASVVLPGLLLLTLVWTGARMAVTGAIEPGELVAFYGYVVFLLRPLLFIIDGISGLASGRVAARRLADFLNIQPRADDPVEPAEPRPWPGPCELVDEATGVQVRPGLLTAVVADDPTRLAGLADRLARYRDPPARLAGTSLAAYPLAEVRRHIHLLGQDAQLFSGDIRTELDVDGARSDAAIVSALHTAAALDIVGLDPALIDREVPPAVGYHLHREVAERGRGFSGGERQRLMLARALLTDAEVLVLDEPTSAVDAQTEQRIASRLARYRHGRTTVVLTTSPLLLAVADRICFVGASTRYGTHRELLADPSYRQTVTR